MKMQRVIKNGLFDYFSINLIKTLNERYLRFFSFLYTTQSFVIILLFKYHEKKSIPAILISVLCRYARLNIALCENQIISKSRLDLIIEIGFCQSITRARIVLLCATTRVTIIRTTSFPTKTNSI